MKYYHAEACRNTFVLFDCLETGGQDEAFLKVAHQCLALENRDDALILTGGMRIEDTLYARMVVLGMDGNLGEFCGNGSRACAAYLFARFPCIRSFYLSTRFGHHPLRMQSGGDYSIILPSPIRELNPKFIADVELFKKVSPFTYVEMIEPHLVIEGDWSDQEVLEAGRELNQNKAIFPLGINVNAWRRQCDGTLFVKTYERGVQRLTQSCGTGSMACAVCAIAEGKTIVRTPGGNLEITIGRGGVQLSGPAFFSDRELSLS
jgi:diaminopimelate epimerase